MANDPRQAQVVGPIKLGHGAKFGRRKELAIASLLSSETVQKAAKKTGVSVSTLKRWMADDEFSRHYENARKTGLDTAIGILAHNCVRASIVLDRIANSRKSPTPARVSAARATISLAIKGKEVAELAREIEEIKRVISSERRVFLRKAS